MSLKRLFRIYKGTNKGTDKKKNAVPVENTAFYMRGEAGI